jgi:NitT/TauT family transport system substrate-binding protein
MQIMQTRRRFLAGAAIAGAAGIVGLPESLHAEPPLETTTVRLPRWVGGSYCWAGAYIAGELMRAEGFTDVRYVEGDRSIDQSEWIARGETDFSVNFPPNQIASIDAGVPIKVLTGLHSGCLELIANESIPAASRIYGAREWALMVSTTRDTCGCPSCPPMSGSIPSTISSGS